MALNLSRFNQWRYQLGLAWLMRSIAPQHHTTKERWMWAAVRVAGWVLPAIQLSSAIALAWAAFTWAQSTDKSEADAFLVSTMAVFVAVVGWGVFELAATHQPTPQNSPRAKLGHWLTHPIRFYDDRSKRGLARRLVQLELPPDHTIYLYPVEAWCLQLLLLGLTHVNMRRDALESALPEAVNTSPIKPRF